MDIRFLKREEEQREFLPVERLNLLYNLLTTILIIIFYNRLQHPQEMLFSHFIIVIATFSLVYLYTRYPSPAIRLVRIVSQMSLLVYWYPETFEFNRIFPNLDHIFAQIELSIFGCQPAILFEQIFDSKIWRELFNLGYWAYYPMIAIVCFWYFFKEGKSVGRCTFIIQCSFFVYYLLFIFLPVAGPQFYFPVIGYDIADTGPYPAINNYFDLFPNIPGPQIDKEGFFTSLVNIAQASGERPTAAFPSSHIGITVILLILAFKSNKRLGWALTPLALLLCCATVYIKAHYLIDAFAGIISGLLLYALTSYIYNIMSKRDFV